MSESRDSGVIHLDPNKDKYNMVGIALAAEGHNAWKIIDFYHKAGFLPDVHPAVLYEVKPRGAEGHKLTRALVSLEEGLTLNLSTHLFYVTSGGASISHNPNQSDVESARRTLEIIGMLKYEVTANNGDGTEIKIPVDVTQQIEDLLGLHLATPIRES